jgi:hypothetical protein
MKMAEGGPLLFAFYSGRGNENRGSARPPTKPMSLRFAVAASLAMVATSFALPSPADAGLRAAPPNQDRTWPILLRAPIMAM